MTFAAVGGNLSSAAGATTFSLTPNTVGNLILFEIENPSATVWATALSSSNVTWSTLPGRRMAFPFRKGAGKHGLVRPPVSQRQQYRH